MWGVRGYHTAIGRFTSIDPTPGGNANEYDYVTGDPVNNTDLTGNWPDWGAVLGVVAQVAEIASLIPGPIGTTAAFISAGAYLATGNTTKAAEMAITGAANLIGAGLAAKAAFKLAGKTTAIGRVLSGGVAKAKRGRASVQSAISSRTAYILPQRRDLAIAYSGMAHSPRTFPKAGTGRGTVSPAGRDPKRLFAPNEKAQRLGQSGGCEMCRGKLPLEDLIGHHIRRWADGGRTSLSNLALLCRPCHKKLHRKRGRGACLGMARDGRRNSSQSRNAWLLDSFTRPRRLRNWGTNSCLRDELT